MKKSITLVVCALFLLPSLLIAGQIQEMQKQAVAKKNGASPVSCTNTVFSCNGSLTDHTDLARSDNSDLLGDIYSLTSGDVICNITVKLKAYVTITGKTFYAKIYALDGSNNLTGSPLATSVGVTGNGSWDYTAVDFPLSTRWTVTSTANYGVVITPCSALGVDCADYDNYVALGVTDACSGATWGRWYYNGNLQGSTGTIAFYMIVNKQ